MSTDDRDESTFVFSRGDDTTDGAGGVVSYDLGAVQETDAWFDRVSTRRTTPYDLHDDLTGLFVALTTEVDSTASAATERLRVAMGERPVWLMTGGEPVHRPFSPPEDTHAVRHAAPAHLGRPVFVPGFRGSVKRWAPVVLASTAVLVFFSGGVSVAMGKPPTAPVTTVTDVVARWTAPKEAPTAAKVQRPLTAAKTAADANQNDKAKKLLKAAKENLDDVPEKDAAALGQRIDKIQQQVDEQVKAEASPPSSPSPTTSAPPASPSPTASETTEPESTPTSTEETPIESPTTEPTTTETELPVDVTPSGDSSATPTL